MPKMWRTEDGSVQTEPKTITVEEEEMGKLDSIKNMNNFHALISSLTE